MNVFLTGGTGFVGGFLASELLKSGHFVTFLARSNNHLSAEKRVQAVLKFVEPYLHKSFRPLYRVIEGDITRENLGLSAHDQRYLVTNRPEMAIHGAASVDFSEANGHVTERINIDGTRNFLALAGKLRVKRLGYLSTLYVAGKRNGTVFEADLEKRQTFNNVYEQTKLVAETLVRRWHQMTGIPFTIYRLPIVIGSSTTGKTLSYTGFYGFFKAFWGLTRNVEKRLQKDPRLGEAGVHLSHGQISIPLFVKCAGNSRINLAPIDWVVNTIASLCDRDCENLVFHLTQPNVASSREIIRTALSILGLRGFRLMNPNRKNVSLNHEHPVLSGYQRMVDSIVDRYLPYTMNQKTFDNANLVKVMGNEYSPPPEIDRELLQTILSYAMHTEFRPPSLA